MIANVNLDITFRSTGAMSLSDFEVHIWLVLGVYPYVVAPTELGPVRLARSSRCFLPSATAGFHQYSSPTACLVRSHKLTAPINVKDSTNPSTSAHGAPALS